MLVFGIVNFIEQVEKSALKSGSIEPKHKHGLNYQRIMGFEVLPFDQEALSVDFVIILQSSRV